MMLASATPTESTQLQPSTILQQISHHARQQPDQPALQGNDISLSYAELELRIDTLSQRLQASGFSQLGLLMENGPDWIICQLAALKAGLCLIPIPLFFSRDQIRHTLDSCGIELLICDKLNRLDTLGVEAYLRPDIHPGAARRNGSDHNCCPTPLTRPADTCLITFTSGTTGQPKGVCLSSRSLDQLCRSLYQQLEPIGIERHCCLLPLSVLLEHVAGALLSLYAGVQCSIYPSTQTGLSGSGQLQLPVLAALLNQTQPHSLILVPELLQALVGMGEVGMLPDSLRFVAVGGGHVPPKLLQQAQHCSIPVFEGYGLSECGSVVALNTPLHRRDGAVGQPLPHCQIKLSADNEILVRGATMLGYLGEHKPSQADDHKWLATGDIGHLDDGGYLYIQGRKGNQLINSFGRNLSPEWIEAELCASPLISQACLFGDSRPFNVAVITTAAAVDADNVDDWINQLNIRLPDYARIGQWIATPQPFTPSNDQLTANGRLRRCQIASAYQTQIEQCYLTQPQPSLHTQECV